MHLVNQGQLAAALILAGVSLPAEFNMEESVIARKEEEQRGIHPKLDKVALDLLAQVAAAKDLAAELAVKKAEFEVDLPAGADAATVALFKKAHGEKTAAVLGEIQSMQQKDIIEKASAAAEAAVLKKHGLMRDDKGALVPFKDAAELQAELEPETAENIEKPIGIAEGTAADAKPFVPSTEPSDITMGTGADAKPVVETETGELEPAPEEKAEAQPEPEKKETVN